MSPIMLTAHFSLDGPDGLARGEAGPFTPTELANMRAMAELAESFRSVLGVPMLVTDGLRRPAHNAAVGGVNSSQHIDGSALDFVPQGISQLEAWRRLTKAEKAGQLPDYGQLIFYPFPLPSASHGHIHLSLANRGKHREKLVRINEDDNAGQKYAQLTAAWLQKFPGGSAALLVALIAAAVILSLLFPRALHG